MTRFRRILGYLAAVLLLLSSAAHSILGWKQLQQRAVDIHMPPDLLLSLKLGWLFGGAAMLMFAVITWMLLWRNRDVLPVLVLGALYAAFGIWALTASKFDPFFSVFIVPGLLLVVAGWPSGKRQGT